MHEDIKRLSIFFCHFLYVLNKRKDHFLVALILRAPSLYRLATKKKTRKSFYRHTHRSSKNKFNSVSKINDLVCIFTQVERR